MNIRPFLLYGLLLVCCRAIAQEKTDNLLSALLRKQASPALLMVLEHPDSFRYQLIYTRIDRDKDNRPHFQNYYYRVNSREYFNPASTVKLPLALLALEKMDSLGRYGVDKETPMYTDSAYSGQTTAYADSSANDGVPSLAQYIRKIFLVSDNDAYNRLYEFLGQAAINRRLWQLGYPDIRITRRFVPMTEEENRHTNPIRFVRGGGGAGARDSGDGGRAGARAGDRGRVDGTGATGWTGVTLYRQPPAYSALSFDFSRKVLIGNAYYDRHDSLVHDPMDFTRHNNFPLEDAQRILQSVLFPGSVPGTRRFRLSAADYRFLYKYMSEYPRESAYPHFDTAVYFDSYTKFFLFKAGRTPVPSYIRIFNKPGWSYGFLTDIAYVVDFKNKVEFMLTGTIYVNSDGILNDDKYEYDETGYPFFKEVGNIIYRYELERPRKYRPDLSRFVLTYGPMDY